MWLFLYFRLDLTVFSDVAPLRAYCVLFLPPSTCLTSACFCCCSSTCSCARCRSTPSLRCSDSSRTASYPSGSVSTRRPPPRTSNCPPTTSGFTTSGRTSALSTRLPTMRSSARSQISSIVSFHSSVEHCYLLWWFPLV